MSLNQESIVSYLREANPELYKDYTDAEIYRGVVGRNPQLAEHFEYEPEGVTRFEKFGGAGGFWDTGEVLTHTERFKQFFPKIAQDIDVGITGILFNNPELANERRNYYDAINEHIFENNPRLQADIHWKQTEPGWTSMDAAVRAFSEAAPSLAVSISGMVAGAGVTAAGGALGAPGMATTGAAYLTAMAPILLMETGSHYTESLGTFIDEYGMSPEEAQDYAQVSSLAYGAISSSLELLGVKHFTAVGNSIMKGVGRESLMDAGERIYTEKAMRKIVDYGVGKSALVRGTTRLGAGSVGALSQGLVEGVTESLQSLTGMSIQRAMEMGAEGDPSDILDRLQGAFVEAAKEKQWMEEGFAGFTTGIFGFGGAFIRGTESQKRFDKLQESLRKADKDLETSLGAEGIDIDDEGVVDGNLFGSFLDSILDPKLGGEVQELAQDDGGVLAKRITETVEIEDAGFKILQAVGANKDLVSEIVNHENSDKLLEEVRKSLNTQRGENSQIAKGDTDTIVETLEAFSNYGELKMPSDEATETFGDEVKRTPTIQWQNQGTPDIDEQAPDTRQDMDSRESGQGPDDTGDTSYQEQVASGEISDPETEKQLAAKAAGQTTKGEEVDTSPDTSGEVAILELAKEQLVEKRNALPKNDKKGRAAIGKQIFGLEQNIRNLKKGVTTTATTTPTEDASPETDEPTTIRDGDTVSIGGKGRFKGMFGTVVGDTKPGEEKGSYKIKLEGGGTATIAKSVVTKEIKESPEKKSPPSKEVDTEKLIKEYNNLKQFRNVIVAEEGNLKPIDKRIGDIEKQLEGAGVKVGEAQAPATVTKVDQEETDNFVVHSGGALNPKRDNRRDSADLIWEDKLKEKGVTTESHSFQGHKQGGGNKVVHSKAELKAADDHIDKANETLDRSGKGWTTDLNGYVRNLFRRSWYQVKDASQVLAVGDIVTVDGVVQVDGGTGATVQMAIDNNKPVYVYDQKTNLWKTWDGEQFVTTDTPTLAPNSATIGTREITATGKAAIDDVINKTFTQDQTQDVETTQTEDVHPAILEERQKRHDENIKLQKTRNLKELRAVAKEHGFPNHQKMTKKQIIEALENQTPGKLMDESVQFPDSDAKLQKIIDDYEAREGASGGVYRSGITAEDVHNAADEAGLDVDTDEFRSLSKQVVGQEHIDNMSNNQRGRMIDHLEGRTAERDVTETPEAADPTAVAEFTPEQMAAINDPEILYSAQDALLGEPIPPKQTKTNDPEQKPKDSESANYDDEMDLLQEKGSSKEILAREDKELRDKILKRLKKFFPHVDVKTFDGVLKIHGIEVVGWATERAIAWSTTDATLDTIPHEYAHIYVKLLANEKIIKLGIKKYETEEKLVQAIGEYYTNRMRNKSLMKRMKIWLKQFANRLKRYFGVEPKNKEDVMKFIAEEFFQGRWLGIEVEVGAGWIDFQERRTSSELSELGNMVDEASGADGTVGEESDSNLKDYPTDVKLSNMFNSLLGIYIDKKDIPNIIELAQKSRSFEEYKNNLWNWANQMAKKRQMRGDDKIRDKRDLSNRENGKLHLDWIKANRRINNWLRDDNTTKTLYNRVYQHLILGDVQDNPEGLQIRGKRDLANDKDHPISSTRNFVEEEIRIGVHENRPMMLPVKQILNKRSRNDGSGNFYVKASYDLTVDELERLQNNYGNRFINSIKTKIQALKKDALAKLEEGVSEEDVKRDLIQSLIDLGGKDVKSTLLSVIGSKLGDHSAIISTKAAETSMTLTPEKFKNILDNAVENNLIRPEHRDIMMKDSNFESLENNNRDIINLPWSQYIVNKALDEDLSINDLLSTILDNDLAYMGEMKNKMAQSLAQLRFWQDIRTPDYFMYENSASDSMVRLSIDLAEGVTPINSGKGRLMIIDADSKIRNTRNDHNDEAIEYDKVDGATFVGSGYMDKLAKALGYGKGEDGTHKLWQLKTFIRQRTMNEETGDVDYLGMKHMMFTVSDGMTIENKNGDEIARVVTRQGQTYWRNSETGELFDMIASPNEAKMTFGGFASTQQKIDAFGEGDYENGYYKIHEIDESSIAVTQMSKGSKTSAAHPIAFAEFLLDMGFESKEVQGLLKEIRGRYIDVLNHYTDTIQSFHENPALLKEYITKNRDENEVPDELEELIDLIDDDGMGIFHDALYTHIKPVLNSRIIQDGINKARSFNNDSSVLYLKPVTNLPLKEMEDSTGHKGLMASAQNTTVFKHIEQLYFRSIGVRLIDSSDVQVTVMERGEEVQRSWDDISFGRKIDILNDYLAENETWTLVHRNPLQKVTAPVLRRMHKLVKGSHGETFFMSEEDVKNVIDGDWDGDKGAVEFISESHAEAMEKWHNSDAHTNANKILKLEFFGERTDRDESIADTSVLSRSDMNDEVSRNSMADGSTGIMVNAMTIARQLFHKKFEMSIDGFKHKIRVADFDKKSDEGTVMDYLPLDIGMLNRNKGELLNIIKSNGDYIVDADGNTIDLDSKIEATDVELYLKTTKANELSLLFQMAVDGAKYRFYSQIINKTGKTPFDFAISRMFERSDKKPLSEMDIRTLSTIYTTQNMSKQRGGQTQSGLAATYEISIAQSDALLNRINKERPDDSQLKKQDSKGRTKGTKTNKNYAKSFLTEVLNAISSRWQKEWYGHSPADIKISMENNITPLESLMMSTGYKLKQSDEYLRHTNTVLRKEAHLMANQVLMERLQDSEFYDNLINGRLQDDYQKAEDFIYEKMDLPDAGDGRLSDVVQKYKDKNVKSVSFHDIWTMLKNYKYSQDAVKADLDEAYIGFVDRFLDKWNSLTPESQHWVTLRMLAGTQNTMYVMKLLPIKLQSKEMLGMYLKAYGEAFNSEIFEQRIDAAGGLQNLEEIAPQRQFNRFTQKGMYGAFIGHVHKVNEKNQKEDDKMNVCGTKGGK